MPILIFLKPVWAFLQGISWKVWAGLLLMLALWYWGHTRYEAGYDKATEEHVEALKDAQIAYGKQVVENQKKADAAVKQLLERTKNAEDKLNADIAGLRAGTVKLQKRFRCPAAPSANPSGSDGGSESGLLREDAEFLLREAGRADDIVRKLQTCQTIIKEYNDGL